MNSHRRSAVSKTPSDRHSRNSFELQPQPPPQRQRGVQLQMEQDDKFFSRLMSKETSMPNSSSRVYYARASLAAVPFTWESHPGTPKHAAGDTALPPLTPPPSHHAKSKQKKTSKSTLFSSIFPCLNIASPSSPLSLHGPDSNPFANSSINPKLVERRRSYFSYSTPPVDRNCMNEDDDADGPALPTSTLCFGG